MVESSLNAVTPLDGVNLTVGDSIAGDTTLSEVVNLDIVSIATPLNGHERLSNRLKEATGMALPAAGQCLRQRDERGDTIALLGLQSDQCFMVTSKQSLDPVATLELLTGDAAYLTDQSDSWAILKLEGGRARTALERICPLDLSDDVFHEKSVARTSMEHLSVIIEKTAEHTYRLYSPRSSADSFLQALRVSLDNVSY